MTAPPSPSAAEQPIGRPGEPVRVLSFASGGFETVRQLGAVHAILVSGRSPPDLVIGASAGAVNAVAAADILQAGRPGSSREEQLAARVARFREVFDSYQNCPADLAATMLPDTYEIDVHRPLEQLRLPIQAELERIDRGGSLTARAGILHLYNDLLRLRVTVSTATRFVRRYLGLAAVGAEPRAGRRRLAFCLELFRSWVLVGFNLPALAPLFGVLVRAGFGRTPDESGSPAAHLIFRSRLYENLRGAGIYLLSFTIIAGLWMGISSVVMGLAALLFSVFTCVGCTWSGMRSLPTGWLVWPLNRAAPWPPGIALIAALGALGLAGLIFFRKTRRAKAPDRKAPSRDRGKIAAGILVALLTFLTFYSYALLASALLTKQHGTLLGALVHNTAVATAGAIMLGLLGAVIAGASRETGQTDEFLGVLGAVLGFLGVYWVFLGAFALVLWLGVPTARLGWGVLLVWLLLAACLTALLRCGPMLPVNLLKNYDIANALGSEHPIRRFLTRLFDPEYYGRTPMNAVLEHAMEYSDEAYATIAGAAEAGRTKLKDYAGRSPGIHVAVTAAEVTATPGDPDRPTLRVLSGDTPVIDGLLAAMAVTPFLPPRRTKDPPYESLYVDASNVANEPTGAALGYLRRRVHEKASAVHIYSVSHLPLTRGELDRAAPEHYAELLNVVYRARELERFRDATLDRRLTHLYSRALPGKLARCKVGSRTYLRAWVYPMEPERPGRVNQRVIRAANDRVRRSIIAETVADGCRTALETMVGEAIRSEVGYTGEIKCRRLMALLRERDGVLELPGVTSDDQDSPDPGPGVAGVCQACALYRGAGDERPRTLRAMGPRDNPAPYWPAEGRRTEPAVARTSPAGENAPPVEANDPRPMKREWPRTRTIRHRTASGCERPTISLLFSGGVFRGVYQMGALNALNEAGLEPDVIAGASVGSITAAMIARVFQEAADTPAGRLRRGARIARLAAVYLGIDRLVMTDRFADFIRAVTIRAANTRFSIRDADRVFRRYDSPWIGIYERTARRVIAGVERLCYVSPFELKDLIEATRRSQHDQTSRLLRNFAQDWLNRLGVGNQILGAESLQLLIDEFVLDALEPYPGAPAHTPIPDVAFDVFRKNGICFLATVTNLTAGRLEVLGSRQLDAVVPGRPKPRAELLGQGLLASSAFPAVFRPRWSWEFLPEDGGQDRYVDGGVTDNLPLDAVAEFLYEASKAGFIRRRPRRRLGPGPAPHLLLATSLEPRLESLSLAELDERIGAATDPETRTELIRKRVWAEGRVKELETNWPALYRRASRLRYNLKLDSYAVAQEDLRSIVKARPPTEGESTPSDAVAENRPFEPLDLEVVAVKPAWLPGTFAFHPMMGFRRERQARSIAHGCRTTLLTLGSLLHGEKPRSDWAREWGLRAATLPSAKVVRDKPLKDPAHKPGSGRCWIRPSCPCPFAKAQVKVALAGGSEEKRAPYDLDAARMERTAAELDRIHQLCGEWQTHERKED